MINFYINRECVSPTSLWYHYQKATGSRVPFTLTIDRSEKGIINLIEQYCQCQLGVNKDLQTIIIEKDYFNKSLGLMWHILNYMENLRNKTDDIDWKWVINNITSVNLTEDHFELTGEASPYQPSLY